MVQSPEEGSEEERRSSWQRVNKIVELIGYYCRKLALATAVPKMLAVGDMLQRKREYYLASTACFGWIKSLGPLLLDPAAAIHPPLPHEARVRCYRYAQAMEGSEDE